MGKGRAHDPRRLRERNADIVELDQIFQAPHAIAGIMRCHAALYMSIARAVINVDDADRMTGFASSVPGMGNR